MYTRDTAFVVGSKLYYSSTRKMKARNGELENVIDALSISDKQTVAIPSDIEGGDVLVSGNNNVYIGHSSRTSLEAITFLDKHMSIKKFALGEHIMHLDTRLTLLSDKIALLNPSVFTKEDLSYLRNKYTTIEVYDGETKNLVQMYL